MYHFDERNFIVTKAQEQQQQEQQQMQILVPETHHPEQVGKRELKV